MVRDSFGGPKLPKALLDKVQDGGVSKRKRDLSRKDRRKAERQQKKGNRSRPVSAPQRRIVRHPEEEDFDDEEDQDNFEESVPAPASAVKKDKRSVEATKPVKSILKKRAPTPDSESGSEEESEDEVAAEPRLSSRTVKARLAEDDDEIAALEKKLGLKTGKKSKAADEDGLDWLLGDSEGEEDDRGGKRKRPDDEKWLRDKRRKAGGREPEQEMGSEESEQIIDELEGFDGEDDESQDNGEVDNPFSDDELSGDDFDAFESEEEAAPPPPKKERENPYVAPVPKDAQSTQKYIPPSLRKAASSDDELLKQLRRQAQGQLNRLSEDNMLSILQAIEQLYAKNARGHVTSTMVDLLISLIAEAAALPDNFLILHAGFSAALYRTIGVDFGAQLLERLVEAFDQYRSDPSSDGKQTLNILAFASYLYTFNVIGPIMIFDFIRLLLDSVTETNTELLLRIIRTCGPQLRQDDPSALKDVVLSLQRSVAAIGEAQLSVRTKFMMETINNLKNNRMKTGAAASAITSEHTIRMKKTLGTLSARTGKSTEPLRVSLSDIRDAETKGKWWLIGASYLDPAKMASTNPSTSKASRLTAQDDDGYESETPGSVNLTKLARAQGMNTDVRRAIFISLLSASDCKDGYERLMKLRLKSKQEQEIPRVLLQCAGNEGGYNAYYTLVAKKLCSGEGRFTKAFAFALLGFFNEMGETDAKGRDDDDGETMGVRKIVNLGKLYGNLVAGGGLGVTCLKTLQFGGLKEKTAMFVEVMLTTVLVQVRKKYGEEGFERAAGDCFGRAHEVPEMVVGLRFFIERIVAKADVANGKGEKKTVRRGCVVAVEALRESARPSGAMDLDSDSD